MPKIKQYRFYGVFKVDGKFATINLIPGHRSANEELVKIDDTEYRIWDWWTSKPCAAFKNGLKKFFIERGHKILYLGIASGKTASYFSDIVGKDGLIYGIDISSRVLREAIHMSGIRGNIVCILGDCRKPEEYENVILEKADLLYEDVSDKDQIPILIRNAKKFLKPRGWAAIAIKSQSIDVTKDPKLIYNECLKELERYFEIIDKVELDPYEKFHMFVVLKMKT